MGVHGLWDIVGPGGRRVSISSLEGRTVAVDASIWMAQFVKAMRDGNGDMLRGAHLVGFFRRLCKLYYYKMKPIIVFDGPPPPLKRRTLRERRLRREQEEEALQRTAEKLVHQIINRKERRANLRDAEVTIQDIISGKVQEPEDEELVALRNLLPKEDRVSAPLETESSGEDVLQLARERRRVRENYYSSIPEDFRGFFEHRRRLEDLNVPTNLAEILRPNEYVEDKPGDLAAVSRDVTEYKELRLSDNSAIQIPLDCQIDESVFRALPAKLQYKILLQLRQQELMSSRKRIIAAADEPDVFSMVQMESYLRQLKTNEEIDKVKKKIAIETTNTNARRDDPLEDDGEEGDPMAADEPGSFMQYYEMGPEPEDKPPTTTTFEEDILKDLEEQKKQKALEAQRIREKMQRREAGGKGSATKRMKLFNEWVEQSRSENADIVARAQASWWNGFQTSQEEDVELGVKQRMAIEPLLEDDVIDLHWDEDMTDEALKSLPSEQQPDAVPIENSVPVKRKLIMRKKEATPIKRSKEEEEDGWDEWEAVDDGIKVKDEKAILAETIPLVLQEVHQYESSAEAGKKESNAGDTFRNPELDSKPSSSADSSKASDSRRALDATSSPQATTSESSSDGKSQIGSVVGDDEEKPDDLPHIAVSVTKTSTQDATAYVTLSEKAFEKGLRVGEEDRQTLEEDSIALLKQIRRSKERSAETLSLEMMEDIRELLRTMGIPYVNAPGEAEAQAVELCKLGLAELVISDDSDSLVFGGENVIRHMFDSDTTVELYAANDIDSLLGLRTEEMRALAILLGCDYTLGIKGVGIVNALEILEAYGASLEGLRKFTKWAKTGRCEETSAEILEYQKKHKNYRIHWEFPLHENYPSEEVMNAFLKPRVNRSTERFHWVVPDVAGVIDLMQTRGYVSNEDQLHNMLTPVVERFKQPFRVQQLITHYLPTIAQYKSQRLKKAIKIIQGKKSSQSV